MDYYVMKDENDRGVHVVHADDCQFLPNPENRTDLGQHDACDDAMTAAREHYDAVDGCHTCCSDCHSGD